MPDVVYVTCVPHAARILPKKQVVRKHPPHSSLQSIIADARKLCFSNHKNEKKNEPAAQNTEPKTGISLHRGVHLYCDDKSAVFNNSNVNISTPWPRYVM